MTGTAMIHSLHATDEVTIIQYKDNNHVVAEYNGNYYTAIGNPFTGPIYVDNIHGKVDVNFRF